MPHLFTPTLLFYYGFFLILCGITAVVFIGMKAKTALISGGTSGIIAMAIGHGIAEHFQGSRVAGVLFCLALTIVFSWRSAKTIFTLLEMIQNRHADVKGKAIAFLIIGLMAIVTIIVLLLQLVAL